MSAITVFGQSGVVKGNPIPPIATLSASPDFGVIGSVVKLDARGSSDPNGATLTYAWAFDQVPIGSFTQVEGFRELEDDAAVVTFSPDKVGDYVVRLTVSNGTRSNSTTAKVTTRAILIPDGRGIVPDGKFIWSYIRDVWQGVENKEVFETFWSALIQLAGAELLKAYEVDFNKSIRDIQDLSQKRWMKYEPKLELDSSSTSIFFGNQAAGIGATTEDLGKYAKAIVLGNELVVVEGSVVPEPQGRIAVTYSKDSDNIGKYELSGLNAAKTGYRLARSLPNSAADLITQEPVVFDFGFQSTSWDLGGGSRKHNYAELLATQPDAISQLSRSFAPKGTESAFDIRPGDIVHVLKGRNLGFYRVLRASGSFITVDRAPVAASDGAPCNVYRPVGIQVTPPSRATTNIFAVPYVPGKSDVSTLAAGRVITVGTQTFTILRSYIDLRQGTPVVVVTTDGGEVIPDLVGLSWRVPYTLVSETQNFEELGVSAGDLVTFDLSSDDHSVVEVRAQVVGVDRNRLGFVLSTDPTSPGVVPSISNDLIASVASGFKIPSADYGYDGVFRTVGLASDMITEAQSLAFQRAFANRAITPTDPVTVLGKNFYITPRSIIRNHLVPVPDLLRSVPALQEWVVQPQTIERNGKWYQTKGDQTFPIRGKPAVLVENQDFVVDDDVAYDGELTFRVGSNVVESQGISFFDRGIVQGDVLRISSPAWLAADYRISAITGPDRAVLSVPLPGRGVVTTRAQVLRRRGGRFLRIVPGLFTAKTPMPPRLWAEVSYFDNSEAVEGNFGILVGLTKSDLEKVSTTLSYRQAVAGLMFAYTRGSAINKIRLGAQILLGLPFAEHRGVIRAIDEDYRLDSSRKPILGRILVEDVDPLDEPLGTLRVYTYPIDTTSELAGVETNPSTKKTYVVGDVVGQFAALSKGVEVIDYLSGGADALQSPKDILQQFHSFRLRANDSIFSLDELTLVSSFLKRITPSAVAFVILSSAEFQDVALVRDYIYFRLGAGDGGTVLTDNISLGIPTALMFDYKTWSGREAIFWDEGAHYPLVAGSDLTIEGGAISVTKELLTPPDGEGTLVRPGDLLVMIEGLSAGHYTIDTVSAHGVTLVGSPSLVDDTGISWAVMRKVVSELRRGTGSWADAVNGDSSVGKVLCEVGLKTDLVAVGDWFIDVGMGSRHVVTDVQKGVSGKWDTLLVVPSPGTGSGHYRIFRPALLESPSTTSAVLTSTGTAYQASTEDMISLLALADPLDELEVTDVEGKTALCILDPLNLDIQPVLSAGSYTVRLRKMGRPVGAVSFDQLDRNNPADWAEIRVSNVPGQDRVTFTSGSKIVGNFDLGINPLPGDFLETPNGPLSDTDIGYGKGRFPIVRVSGGVALSVAAPSNGAADWKLCRWKPPKGPFFGDGGGGGGGGGGAVPVGLFITTPMPSTVYNRNSTIPPSAYSFVVSIRAANGADLPPEQLALWTAGAVVQVTPTPSASADGTQLWGINGLDPEPAPADSETLSVPFDANGDAVFPDLWFTRNRPSFVLQVSTNNAPELIEMSSDPFEVIDAEV